MLTALKNVLNNIKKAEKKPFSDPVFILLYESVLHIMDSQENNDAELIKKTQELIGFHELAVRGTQTDVFMSPHSPVNQLILQLARVIAEKTQQPIHSILYARALVWPENTGNWYDPIMGDITLPIDHSEFIVTSDGDVCQFECLIDTAINAFSEGHREHHKLWQNNDPRRLNHPLPMSLIQLLCSHFASFKQFYERIVTATTDTPLSRLQALREGLRDGSKLGSNAQSKGAEYNAGSAANEAIAFFSLWWNDITHISYTNNQSLQHVLSQLKTNHQTGRNLGEFLAIILRDQSANINEKVKDAKTCVQLRGDELESAIVHNIKMLSSFERQSVTKTELFNYKLKILAEFRKLKQRSPALVFKLNHTLIISIDPHQLPYFAYALTQSWANFCSGDVSDVSLFELRYLLQQMTESQCEQLLLHSVDFDGIDAIKLGSLRIILREMEVKAEENILLPANDQHEFKLRDKALLDIISFNTSLFIWIFQRYEFITFTNPILRNYIIEKKRTVTIDKEQFIIHDFFNFAYYAYRKTEHVLNGKQKQKQLLSYFFGTPVLPISPIHLYIRTHNMTEYEELLVENPSVVTHVDWRTGNSILVMAAMNGRNAICTLLLKHGANPTLKNKKGKLAEALWPRELSSNPITLFRNELHQLAKNTGNLSEERKTQLLALMVKHTHFLTWPLDSVGNTFLHLACAVNPSLVMDAFIELPDWEALSHTRTYNNFSLLHSIAWAGHDVLYSALKNITRSQADDAYALHLSVQSGHERFCKLLLAEGIDPNPMHDGLTPLMVAATSGHTSICRLLFEHGADPSPRNNANKTAMQLWSGESNTNPFISFHDELLQLAQNSGHLSEERKTQLLSLVLKFTHFLTWSTNERVAFVDVVIAMNSTALIHAYIQQGGNPDRQDINGYSSLMFAALNGNRNSCTLLLQNGANPGLINKVGQTAEQIWGTYHPLRENPLRRSLMQHLPFNFFKRNKALTNDINDLKHDKALYRFPPTLQTL